MTTEEARSRLAQLADDLITNANGNYQLQTIAQQLWVMTRIAPHSAIGSAAQILLGEVTDDTAQMQPTQYPSSPARPDPPTPMGERKISDATARWLLVQLKNAGHKSWDDKIAYMKRFNVTLRDSDDAQWDLEEQVTYDLLKEIKADLGVA